MGCRARRPTRLAVFLIVALLGAFIWGTASAAPDPSTVTGRTFPITFGVKIGTTGSGDTN